MAALLNALDDLGQQQQRQITNALRRDAVGSGERSDKRRTWRFQDGLVHDHITGRSAPVDNVLRGDFSKLWK